MSTRTALVAGLGVALVAAVAAVVVIARWSAGDGSTHPPAHPAGTAATAPQGPVGALTAGPTIPAAVPVAEPAAAPPEWSAVPISARPSQLGPGVAGPVLQGLDAARDRMDPCFTAEVERGRAHPELARANAGAGSPILLIELEVVDGAVVVVNAEVETPGRASTLLLDCCLRVLQGWRIAAPQAPSGERFRLRHVLQ